VRKSRQSVETIQVRLRARKVWTTLEIWVRISSSRLRRTSINKWTLIQVKLLSLQIIMSDIRNCSNNKQQIPGVRTNQISRVNLPFKNIRSTKASIWTMEANWWINRWWIL